MSFIIPVILVKCSRAKESLKSIAGEMRIGNLIVNRTTHTIAFSSLFHSFPLLAEIYRVLVLGNCQNNNLIGVASVTFSLSSTHPPSLVMCPDFLWRTTPFYSPSVWLAQVKVNAAPLATRITCEQTSHNILLS